MDHRLITTSFDFKGHEIREYLGIVRGITVRSRSILGNIGAGIEAFFGGNISLFTELCEKTRSEAFEIMVKHADAIGANAIIGVRYDANEIASGINEVLCYGTAVRIDEI